MNYEKLGELKICTEKPLNMPLTSENIEKIFNIKSSSEKVEKVPDIYHNLKTSSNPNSLEAIEKIKAAFVTAKLWKNGSNIHIYIMPGSDKVPRTKLDEIENSRNESGNPLKIDPLQKVVDNMTVPDAIKKIVKERFTPIINLNLIFTDDINESDVRISFIPEEGAWSLIGTDILVVDKSKSTMNLGWFDVATTMHEFGHTFGLIHEHQNTNGNSIQWNDDKVYAWAADTQGWNRQTAYQNIIEKYDSNSINGSTFDPQSIMLYFFPASLTTNNKGTHENLRLSPKDVIYLNKQYPGSPESPETFYKNVYNEDISDADKGDDSDKGNKGDNGKKTDSGSKVNFLSKILNSKSGLYILIGIIVIIIVIVIIILIKKT